MLEGGPKTELETFVRCRTRGGNAAKSRNVNESGAACGTVRAVPETKSTLFSLPEMTQRGAADTVKNVPTQSAETQTPKSTPRPGEETIMVTRRNYAITTVASKLHEGLSKKNSSNRGIYPLSEQCPVSSLS